MDGWLWEGCSQARARTAPLAPFSLRVRVIMVYNLETMLFRKLGYVWKQRQDAEGEIAARKINRDSCFLAELLRIRFRWLFINANFILIIS